MSPSVPSARHYLVSGRVQGVGFRAFTRRSARDLGLTGWVRNLPDGRVEAVAVGDAETLDELERHLRRGPRVGRVDDLTVTSTDPEPFDDFEVRR